MDLSQHLQEQTFSCTDGGLEILVSTAMMTVLFPAYSRAPLHLTANCSQLAVASQLQLTSCSQLAVASLIEPPTRALLLPLCLTCSLFASSVVYCLLFIVDQILFIVYCLLFFIVCSVLLTVSYSLLFAYDFTIISYYYASITLT